MTIIKHHLKVGFQLLHTSKRHFFPPKSFSPPSSPKYNEMARLPFGRCYRFKSYLNSGPNSWNRSSSWLKPDHLSWLRKWTSTNLWSETSLQWPRHDNLSEMPKAWALRDPAVQCLRLTKDQSQEILTSRLGWTSTLGTLVVMCRYVSHFRSWFIRHKEVSGGSCHWEAQKMFVIRGCCILNTVTKDFSFSWFKQRSKFPWKELLYVL